MSVRSTTSGSFPLTVSSSGSWTASTSPTADGATGSYPWGEEVEHRGVAGDGGERVADDDVDAVGALGVDQRPVLAAVGGAGVGVLVRAGLVVLTDRQFALDGGRTARAEPAREREQFEVPPVQAARSVPSASRSRRPAGGRG